MTRNGSASAPEVFLRSAHVFRLDVLREHTELVAAKPREHVAWAEVRVQALGDGLEEAIAGDVPVRVVDQLEPSRSMNNTA